MGASVEPELDELAASGAVVALWAAGLAPEQTAAFRLEELIRRSKRRVREGGSAASWRLWQQAQGLGWQERLRTLLRVDPDFAAELHAFVGKFGPSVPPTPAPSPEATNTISGGTSHGPVIQSRDIGSLTVHAAVAAPAAADDWPRVDELRPLTLGVRPTRRFGDEPSLPPYVPRDCDAELVGMIMQALVLGGLVVVTGEPLSGKTAAAWAALGTSVHEDARIYAPPPGTNLRDLPAQLRGHDTTKSYVVWLDDLEGHLGEHGLTAGLLAQLTHKGVLVLATMNDDAYDTHRFGGGPASRVLSGVAMVQLRCHWSDAELARLAEADDPRLVDAARWRGERGVTEFLAVGHELWEAWRRAAHRDPLGHLLVRSAIDIARCGLAGPVPVTLVEQVSRVYDPQVDDAEDDATESAMAWALEPRLGVAGLLTLDTTAEVVQAYGSLVADAMRFEGTEPVPDEVWQEVLGEAVLDDSLDEGAVKTALREVLAPRAEAGDAEAMEALGVLAEHGGAQAEALDWYRRAAEFGDVEGAGDAGRLLAEWGDDTEAMPYLETAAEAGNTDAMVTLARLLEQRAAHWREMARQTPEGAAKLLQSMTPTD
ncbi:tetratricopeptide repeat protein [Streptomyces sp. NPDC050658]|uniref:tetratricopeptide repeat protein n=1 Tax=unclassified Streptomyces TaxID=2593676 RepID=UPI00341213B5